MYCLSMRDSCRHRCSCLMYKLIKNAVVGFVQSLMSCFLLLLMFLLQCPNFQFISKMKASWLFLFSLLPFEAQVLASETVLAQAFSPELLESMSTDVQKLDLVCFGNTIDSNSASAVIKRASKHFSMKIVSTRVKNSLQLNGSSILLFESADQFRAAAPGIKWLSNPAVRFKHVFHAPNLSAIDVIESIKDGFSIDQVAFLMNETKNSIDLVSAFMFTSHTCRKLQLKTINKFNATTSTWNINEFFPKKYKNMHNCTLSLRAVYHSKHDRPDLFPTSAKTLNFTLNTTTEKAADLGNLKGFDLFDYAAPLQVVKTTKTCRSLSRLSSQLLK